MFVFTLNCKDWLLCSFRFSLFWSISAKNSALHCIHSLYRLTWPFVGWIKTPTLTCEKSQHDPQCLCKYILGRIKTEKTHKQTSGELRNCNSKSEFLWYLIHGFAGKLCPILKDVLNNSYFLSTPSGHALNTGLTMQCSAEKACVLGFT